MRILSHWRLPVSRAISLEGAPGRGRPGYANPNQTYHSFDKLPLAHFKSSFTSITIAPQFRSFGGSMSRALKLFALVVALAATCLAQDLASFEKRVTVKKLPNGLTAVVCQRP